MAFPLKSHFGSWKESANPDERIIEFFNFVSKMLLWNKQFVLKSEDLQFWKERGCFESNIPFGYGLGSSGALTAAMFDSFIECPERVSLQELKRVLGQIESYFHGASSGTDPLVSYLNQPLIISQKNIELSDISISNSYQDFYLYDSQEKRNTAALVKEYQALRTNDSTFEQCTNEMGVLNDQLILALQHKNSNSFLNNFIALSELQYNAMSGFIPEMVKTDWKNGLDSGEYYMKLCGAGGGGYFLILDYKKQIAMNSNLKPKLNSLDIE